MADQNPASGTVSNTGSSSNNYNPKLTTKIESGHFSDHSSNDHDLEKGSPFQEPEEDDEDDEDLNALIDDLQSEDGHGEDEELLQSQDDGGYVVPDSFLQTDPSRGLTASQVLANRKKFGPNAMKEEKENEIMKFLKFFWGPIPFVMIAAFFLAAGLQDWIDLAVISALLLLNAGIGYWQERQAGNAVAELKKGLALKATVLRDGHVEEIQAPEVVPGDIVVLDEGTIIPADGKIVSIDGQLQVDQAGITGESMAAEKHVGDNCYGGSGVKVGEAVMIVTATGDNTFVGRAAYLVNKASAGTGHFTEVLNGIGAILLALVVFTLLVVWTACFFRGVGIKDILVYTLGITLIGVPVGLPAVVTTTMAVGAMFLGKQQAIVQKLSAIESLAGVDILCSDKTGTLTKNKLILHTPYLVPGIDEDTLMRTACLAASRKKKGIDAIDKVFLKALKNFPNVRKDFLKYDLIQLSPFDPVSKKVQAIVKSPEGQTIICVKGAPAPVLDFVLAQNPISKKIEDEYRLEVTEFARRGFRSLGVARKVGSADWEILGIVPCFDPPRHDTARTIQEAKTLGLQIKMLTGDAVGIAKETASQLGMGTNIYNAEQLGVTGGGEMAGSYISDFVEHADGFAGVFPQHKYNVVDILQKRGHLVAMTGDGVNDAPSLKKADTGIAVEGSTDAARSAADIVFMAPGLGAIILAIKTARQIFHRMHAYIVYRIALSLHLEIFLGLWIAILNQSMSVELIVFIAIFADVATLMIAYDEAPYSKTPVKWNLPKLWAMSIILGVILAAGTWITLATLIVGGQDGGIVQNFGVVDEVVFLQICLTENWLIFITRADGPFWSSAPSWPLYMAVLVVDVAATCMCIFGAFKKGKQTSIVAVIRVWVFSFGVFCVMAGVYYLLDGSAGFDNLVNGNEIAKKVKAEEKEDFAVTLQRVATQHAEQEQKAGH